MQALKAAGEKLWVTAIAVCGALRRCGSSRRTDVAERGFGRPRATACACGMWERWRPAMLCARRGTACCAALRSGSCWAHGRRPRRRAACMPIMFVCTAAGTGSVLGRAQFESLPFHNAIRNACARVYGVRIAKYFALLLTEIRPGLCAVARGTVASCPWCEHRSCHAAPRV